jgi:hypothetical protein
LADCGFDLSECYAPTLQDCSVIGAKVGYELGSSGIRMEAAVIDHCTTDYCMTGVKVWNEYFWATCPPTPLPPGYIADAKPAVAPMFCVSDCTIRARDFGLILQTRRLVQVVRNTFNRLTTAPFTDIQLGLIREGGVTDNIFSGTSSGRTNIAVICGDATAGQAFGNSYDLVLGPNTLSDGQSGTTSPMIWVDPRTYDIFRY